MSPEAVKSSNGGGGPSKLLVVVLGVVVILVVAYFALGMPGMDHNGPDRPANHEEMDM